jgi:general nucleoside transport system ATP-binding protein
MGFMVNGPTELTINAYSLTCRFGSRIAVQDASLSLLPGRIHALVGENGAGKSTLLRMLAGVQVPSSGQVLVNGVAAQLTPASAIERGIGMVYQHFSLIDAFTGLECLLLGNETKGSWGRLDSPRMRAQATELMEQFSLPVPLDLPVREMSVGQKQRLEILKVLVRGARALLLDEPSAVLAAPEVEQLYSLLQGLASQGSTVVVVTHHLREVIDYAHDVTVLRKGNIVFDGLVDDCSLERLAQMAVGEIKHVQAPRSLSAESEIVLRVHDLSLGKAPEDKCDFQLQRGEIVALVGVEGNGQDELVSLLSGLVPSGSGQITLLGTALQGTSLIQRRKAGLEVVFGDRHRFGLLLDASVADNLVLGDLGVLVSKGQESEKTVVKRRLELADPSPANLAMNAGDLSGGNQQKLVIARALDRHPACLIASYPTRGIDLAAAAIVREQLVQAAEQGCAILLVSSDWEEIQTLAHRVLVIHRQRLVGEYLPPVVESEIGKAMMGMEGTAHDHA